MGRKKQTHKNNKTKETSTPKINKEISIFTILFVIVIIAVVVCIYLGTRYLVITLKYKYYTDKMISYGYNELYENDKATATQKVTNGELLKVIIGSIKNEKNISNLYYLVNPNNNGLQQWYEYSEYTSVNNIVQKNELNKKAKFIDAVMLTVSCVEKFVDVEIQPTKLEMNEQKLNKYTKQEQELLAKAVTLGLIENKTTDLSKSTLVKGKLNKLVISVVEKYATMHYKSTIKNENGEFIRQEVNLVTDKNKMPKNYNEYPYIIDNIDKEVYEYDYNIITEAQFTNPKETYKIMGYLNGQTASLIESYFSKILNIDYTTISTKNFLDSIKHNVVYLLDEQDVKTYVEYVKANKIKLEGYATPLLPIMYNNGEQYVIRTKIVFKVLNSNTEYNLLFGDENKKIKYNSKDITMYVDVPTGMTLNARSLLVYVSPLARHIVGKNSMIIVEE